MRKTINFDDQWFFSKPGEAAVPVSLPHTWNNVDGQDGGNDYWRGMATYSKAFHRPDVKDGERVILEIKGAAMTADVLLNGMHLVHHEGGYSTFRTELTEYLEDENTLVITVDNSENDRVYPQRADFTFYGGLYRHVNLIIVPPVHFELLQDGTPGIKVTPQVNLDDHSAMVTVETWQNGGDVQITVDGHSHTVPSVDGYAKTQFEIKNARFWDGQSDPYLYIATAKLSSGDEISARFGCRSFRIDPDQGFFLNGRSYPLRGVSRHQDYKALGNALTIEHQRQDMAIIRDIGANTVRLAHYQHAQEFYDLCDENGIIVWAEIPYISMHMDSASQNTQTQMRELISQNYNHPSILCWGLSNEITSVSAETEDLLENHRSLNSLCHRMDATRFTTLAHVFTQKGDGPLSAITDLSSYNLYFGWYQGEIRDNGAFLDAYHEQFPQRAIGLSEYGADANVRFHSSAPRRGDYTEEYQCLFHEQLLDQIDHRPYLWATHVWNLFDFAADGRDEGGKKGENQKGLVEFDRKTKKDAYYLYKAAWSKEPFVHLCGSRYVDRAEEITQIKVYSNLPKVQLLVDGVPFDEKAGNRVFHFSVPITGEHRIRAIAGAYSDEIRIRFVEAAEESYRCQNSGEVTNWFDSKDEYFSVNDTVGDLMQNPKAAAILMKVFQQSAGSGKSSNVNPAMLQMLSGMSLGSLLKRGTRSANAQEQLAGINKALQQIRK